VSPLPGYTSPRPAWADLDASARHALARQLYAQAGYSAGHPLEVEFTFPTGNQEMRQVFEAMAAMWRTNLGANVQLVSEEFRVHQQNRRIGKLRLFWYSWIADYPDPMTFLWLALRANPQNYGRFDNADYERTMAKAIATVDAGERNRGYNEAEQILDAQMPYIPIYYYKSRHLLRSYVQGWQDAATDQHPSRDLYLAARPDP
jgi:oligopeptide transport system substrate-binding protein